MNVTTQKSRFLEILLKYYLDQFTSTLGIDSAVEMAIDKTEKLMLIIDEASSETYSYPVYHSPKRAWDFYRFNISPKNLPENVPTDFEFAFNAGAWRISEIKEEPMPAPDPRVTHEYLKKHKPSPICVPVEYDYRG